MNYALSDSRTILIISLVMVTGMFLSGHLTNRIYPWLVIFLFLGSVFLIISIAHGQRLHASLTSVILLVGGFRIAAMQIPASTVGDDPQKFALWMRQVINAGNISPISSVFYTDAPLHILFGSFIAVIIDVDPAQTFSIFGILIGVIVPIIAISMARLIGVKNIRLLAITALLAGITTEVIRRTYWPIPQTTAAIFWWLFLFSLLKHVKNPSKRQYTFLILFTIAIVFTHKLPLPIISATLSILLFLFYFDKLSWGNIGRFSETKQIFGIFGVILSLMVGQWLYATHLLKQIVSRILQFFQNLIYATDPVGARGTYEPTAAIPARPGLLPEIYTYPVEFSLYLERSHAIWLLMFSGFAWLTLFLTTRKSEHRKTIHVLLAASAVCTLLILIGQVAVGAMNPTRPLLLIEPVLIVLIIGAIAEIRHKINRSKITYMDVLLCSFVIFLAATQIFAASTAADYANTPRYYLNEPEVRAGETICEYAEGDIYVDQEQHAFSDCEKFNRISRERTDPLYNAEIRPDKHNTVLYRHNVDVYLGHQDRWQLTWDPSAKLSDEYNNIYHNGEVTIYRNDDGNNK